MDSKKLTIALYLLATILLWVELYFATKPN